MKILVCGGRNYKNKQRVFDKLDSVHKLTPISEIIQGGAWGADALAVAWATDNEIKITTYPANWEKWGKVAGSIRNAEMLAKNPNIEMVIAFPGGGGTENMINAARHADLCIIKVHE